MARTKLNFYLMFGLCVFGTGTASARTIEICSLAMNELVVKDKQLNISELSPGNELPACPNVQKAGSAAGGHQGDFIIGKTSVLKLIKDQRSIDEIEFYCVAQRDGENLNGFLTGFHGVCTQNGQYYIHMENAKSSLIGPSGLVDFKLGWDTVSEDANPLKQAKHLILDRVSTSKEKGYRLEGFSPPEEGSLLTAVSYAKLAKEYKAVSLLPDPLKKEYFKGNGERVYHWFLQSVESGHDYRVQVATCFQKKLTDLERVMKSAFSNNSKIKLVGSSILMIHGRNEKGEADCMIKAIDFANSQFYSVSEDNDIQLFQEGYLAGVNNIQKINASLLAEFSQERPHSESISQLPQFGSAAPVPVRAKTTPELHAPIKGRTRADIVANGLVCGSQGALNAPSVPLNNRVILPITKVIEN